MKQPSLKYNVGFSLIPGIGRVRLAQLEAHFGSLELAWGAPREELRRAGLENAAVNAIHKHREHVDLDRELDNMAQIGVRAMTWRDAAYPERLKEIYDYPPILYIKGELVPADEWCLAVVGTRRPALYGRQVTEELVTDLVASGITIVSGLAKGLDTVAHQCALKGGRTVAVLAGGLDRTYPIENTSLARLIAQQGALISEYPPGMRPRPDFFPRRNRILSGLSLGVLVVEADDGSGSLITARHALEQNREVFAVPGSILAANSRGTNRLIQEGAKLVSSAIDILEELNLTQVPQQMEMAALIPASEVEARVLAQLGPEPCHADEITRGSGLAAAEVSSTLVMLELKGLVSQVGAMNYVISRRLREQPQQYEVKVV